MKTVGKSLAAFAGLAAVSAFEAAGQEPAAAEPAVEMRRLTLGTPLLKSAVKQVDWARSAFEKVPDFRLKMDQSGEILQGAAEWETELRGVEIRLTEGGFWAGYEIPSESEEPRATFTIRKGF